MFRKRSENYLSWDEYQRRNIMRNRFMFMQETVLKSIRNHFEKIERGLMYNG